MSFTDPTLVNIGGVNRDFVEVDSGKTGKGSYVYEHTDGSRYQLDVVQLSTTGRFRREMRLTHTKVASDPLTAVNKQVSASVIFAVDEPRVGFTDAQLDADSGLAAVLIDALNPEYNAHVAKLLRGES